MYEFYNANSKGKFVNDCVIRAISIAEGHTWDYTYDKLSDMAQAEGTMFDDVKFVESYLNKFYKKIPSYSQKVGDFASDHNVGTYLVTMRGHITVIIDGVIYDIFDCRDNDIWNVWQVK